MPFGHTLEGGRDLRASRGLGSAQAGRRDRRARAVGLGANRQGHDAEPRSRRGRRRAASRRRTELRSGDARMAQGWWAEDSRARRAAALVDRIARNVERPAGDPLIPRRIERVRVVQVAVRSAEVLTCLELEDPGRVPRLRVLRLELDRPDVAALRRDRPAARLVHPGQREDGFHRERVEEASPARDRARARGRSRRRRAELRSIRSARCGNEKETKTVTAAMTAATASKGRRRDEPGARPAPARTPSATIVGAVTARKFQL